MWYRRYSSALKEGFTLVYKDIQEKILKDIQDELIKSYDCQSMDWNCIKRYLEKLPPKAPKTNNLFWNFFRFLMEIFDSYNIGDSSYVDDVLQCACFATFFDDVSIFPPEKELRSWFYKRGIRYMNRNLLTFERVDDVMRMFPMNMAEEDVRNNSINLLRKIPYAWRSRLGRNEEKPTDCYFHILWELARRGKEYLFLILLKHGVLYLKPTKYQKSEYTDIILLMLCKKETPRIRNDFPYRLGSYQFSPRTVDVLRAVEIIAKIMYRGKDNRRDRPVVAVSCFRKIFDSIPEPFIKVQEVREALEEIVRRDPERLDSAVVEPMCEEFGNNFPESAGPTTPRSLKHLCRFQIRECLRKVAGLPYKVSLLPIPIRLQKYVNLVE